MSNILYEVADRIREEKEKGRDIIQMHIGEPRNKISKKLIDAVSNAMKEGHTKYSSPYGNNELREKLAEYHKVDKENIIIVPGSKFGLYSLIHLLKGKTVAFHSPHWTTFGSISRDLRKTPIPVKTTFENKWQIKEWPKSDIYIINTPSNPTSIVFDTFPEQNNGIHIYDLAYEPIIYDEKTKKKLDKKIDEDENAIKVYSFSKFLGLTGFRVGYIIADKQLIEKIKNYLAITITCVPEFLQIGIAGISDEWNNIRHGLIENYANKLELFRDAPFEFVKPDAGFYIFPYVKDGRQFFEKALKKGVSVVPGEAFGEYNGFVRISLSPSKDRIKKAIEVFEEISSQL